VSFSFASAADSQQPASPRRIGVLFAGSWAEDMVQGFRQGLLDAGYAEGRDLVFEWQSAHGNYDRLPRLAAYLVRSKVDVIVVSDTLSAQAAKRATYTIPIVMGAAADPIGSGLVASLAHPDGNVTGLSIRPELSAKRLQLLKEAIP
jgi:putative ABC transport system substrate-binding protein